MRDITLTIEDGELLGVVGPSGSSKTTLLRVVAGLTAITSRTVRFGDVDVTAGEPAARNVGMVFQSPVLFPHRNVWKNVSFPLEIRHEEIEEIRRRSAPRSAPSISTNFSSGGRAACLRGKVSSLRSHGRWFGGRTFSCSTSRSRSSMRC
jgi:ABC-type lipoprotein export system ATPase subunit